MQANKMLCVLIYNLFLCYLLFMQMDTKFGAYGSIDFSFRRTRGSEEIVFRDVNLENAIREIIQKPTGSIQEADLENITEADLSNQGVVSLEGIEYLINLKKLYLANNKISDILPLEIVLKRGLDEFTIDGNKALNMADIHKLDNWMRSGQKNTALADNLKKIGYHSTPVVKGDLIFTNGVYDLIARDGCVFKVSTAASGKVLWETDKEGVQLVHDIKIMNLVGGKVLVLIGTNGVFEIHLSSQDD